MTVACRMMNCPLNNESICSAQTILIDRDGRCFDLIKGFSQEEINKIVNDIKRQVIEDVESDSWESEEQQMGVDKIDNYGFNEGARIDEIQEACE